MFGRKQRIIETQAALIADLREEIERKVDMIDSQTEVIFDLIEENKALRAAIKATDIDFPNSQKGGVSNTGAVNVSDILNL